MRWGVHTARRGWAEPVDVINTWERAALREFLPLTNATGFLSHALARRRHVWRHRLLSAMCNHDTAYAGDRGLEADDALLAVARDEERTVVTRRRTRPGGPTSRSSSSPAMLRPSSPNSRRPGST